MKTEIKKVATNGEANDFNINFDEVFKKNISAKLRFLVAERKF
jgi:hypothetical protein